MRRKGVACLGRGCHQNLGCLDSPPRGAAGCSVRQTGPAPGAWTRPRMLLIEVQHGAMHRRCSTEGPMARCLTPVCRSDDSHPAGACDHPLNLLFPAKSATAGPAERGAPSHREGNAVLVPRAAGWQGDTEPWGLGVQGACCLGLGRVPTAASRRHPQSLQSSSHTKSSAIPAQPHLAAA